MVAEEEHGDPECREGLEEEDRGRFFVLPVDEFNRVEDECLGRGDRGPEPQYFTGDSHRCPNGIGLPHFEGEFIVKVRVGIELQLVNGGEVLAVIL